jgi:O-antigen ligase
MSSLTTLALFGYLLAVATTQTVYGQSLMNYRWYALIALAAVSAADWIIARHRREAATDRSNELLLTYLLASSATVVFAQNWVFSGMRWASHAAMLLIMMLFLRQILIAKQIQVIVWGIKTVVAALLVVSWLVPAPSTVFDNDRFYRGAMGNANTMGHIAMIAALLYFHGFLISNLNWARYLQGAVAASAIVTVWLSGARSSMVAMLTGALLFAYFYRERTRKLVLGSIILGSLCFLAFPRLPGEVVQFISKRDEAKGVVSIGALKTRTPVWTASWEAFKERPFLGWGFGADSSIPKQWNIQLTALGTVERDAVNDFLFTMEGGGLVGLAAYLLLIYIAFTQSPTGKQRSFLQKFRLPTRNQETQPVPYHMHAILFILVISLLVMTQFDGTGLSAGNLISVILWISVGCAGALRNEDNLRLTVND